MRSLKLAILVLIVLHLIHCWLLSWLERKIRTICREEMHDG